MQSCIFAENALAGDLCEFETLTPTTQTFMHGETKFDLGDSGQLGDPTKANGAFVWEGPITISHADGKECKVAPDVAIMTSPLWLGNEHVLYVPTYSGSVSTLYAVDIKDCKVLWHSKGYTGHEKFSHNNFVLGLEKIKAPIVCLNKLTSFPRLATARIPLPSHG